jgi:hypothetical protein
MNLWKRITRGNETRTARRRPHKAQPGLEAVESRALLSGGGASFRLVNGNLYETQGRHQSLVASDVLYFQFANKRTIIFGEANGDVYKKTVKGAPQLIQAGHPTPIPILPPIPTLPPTPTPNPSPTPNPLPANLPPGTYDYTYSVTDGQETVTNKLTLTLDATGSATMQYALQTKDYPFDASSMLSNYWYWQGQLTSHGSELEFIGTGTRTQTSTYNPSLDEQWSFTSDMKFPFYQWNPGQGTLDLTLADAFGGGVEGPNGLTRNIALTKIA